MGVRVRGWLLVAATLGLGGCGLADGWFGPSEEEIAAEVAERRPVPIERVERLELGRTRDGFLLTAFGEAAGLGFGGPRLAVRRDGQPGPDGFVEFDFLAVPPADGFELGQGAPAARAIRADTALKLAELRGVRGLRVFALTGGVQITF